MNVADSEVVASILSPYYSITDSLRDADLILLNTCSVRDNAEQRIRKRLRELASLKKKNKSLLIGLLGCMAERIKEQLLEEEKTLDFIAGPDAYRSLPQLIEKASLGMVSYNVYLSEEETYDDIDPVRYDSNGVSAFISIMRGCNNFCSYCVVPYTRGRERSRDPKTIIEEAQSLFDKGFREVTLLGQNVNSYCWKATENNIDFADLTEKIAQISPLLRVRYATSHPKDISDKLLFVMAKYPNVCHYIHLPVQSGSNAMLQKMNRVYTREYYLERIKKIKEILPDCAISTDVIAGFCGETEQDHRDTLSLMREVGYEYAFMFKYSVREGTKAAEKLEDDVPEELKIKRLEEIIALQQHLSLESNKRDIGKTFSVLVEGVSKRSDRHLFGRNPQNKVCVFPKKHYKTGDYVEVKIAKCTAGTLLGEVTSDK
ncbi:MAG: tRNA (N6-isopentenyl adenosine(37)-C2)-methylthiotransferase MiaB [Bacteroidetes bacterium]|nr:tRNA (N6-isopentenyl adenosine(37)-C2)-methylthiotransferase MiaB [Bacteroidota bacterium]MCL1968984.1 tRNA (N6-isopentenyl adenosine(37)-C2)-methylthiotransferase MiaB [Bacteroidota bacterium]